MYEQNDRQREKEKEKKAKPARAKNNDKAIQKLEREIQRVEAVISALDAEAEANSACTDSIPITKSSRP